MAPDLPLHRDAIARLIPHAGAMCLLARVVEADARWIVCEADGHTDPGNPLRVTGRLPISAGIEYAAQAAALHAALQGKSGAPKTEAALAAVSDVRWRVERLDDATGALIVRAELITETGGAVRYRFSLSADAGAPLITGELMFAAR